MALIHLQDANDLIEEAEAHIFFLGLFLFWLWGRSFGSWGIATSITAAAAAAVAGSNVGEEFGHVDGANGLGEETWEVSFNTFNIGGCDECLDFLGRDFLVIIGKDECGVDACELGGRRHFQNVTVF